MNTSSKWRRLALSVLSVGQIALLTACSGGGGGGGVSSTGGGGGAGPNPPPPPVQQSPRFTGVHSIAAAGPSAIELHWEPATDNEDTPAEIVYRVFAATTRGGQTFATPVLTTAGGATSVVITSQQLASISAENEVFFVVRAVDTAGNTDENTVELSAVPMAAASVFYVEAGAGGTGTLASPFSTIQEGVNAAEAGGGIVLVAAGVYNEKVDFTSDAADPVSLFGGFPSFATLAGATETQVLAARDIEANVTTISGDGLGFVPPEGLVDVLNDGRRTFFDGFTLTEYGDAGLRGIDVDLQVSGSHFTDGGGANASQFGLRIDTSAVTSYNDLTVVGNEIDNQQRDGVLVGGATAVLAVRNNHVHDISGSGVQSETGLAVQDSESLVVPTGATGARLAFELNRFFEMDNGVRLDLEPEVPASPGTVNFTFRGNDVTFTDSSVGLRLHDLGFFGTGGSGSYTVEDNYFRGASDDHVQLDYLETDPENVPDGAITVTVDDNYFIHSNSSAVDADSMAAAPGALSLLTITDNTFSNFESDTIEVDTAFNGTAGAFDGADVSVNVSNNQFYNGDNNVDLDMDVAPGGTTTMTVDGNNFHVNYGTLVRAIADGYTAPPAAGVASGERIVRITNNQGVSVDDDLIEVDITPAGPFGVAWLEILNNEMPGAADDGLSLDIRNEPNGLGGPLNILVWNNLFENTDSEVIDIQNSANDNDEVNLFVGNTEAIGGIESQAFRLTTHSDTLAVLANSPVGLNDVDSSAALELQHNSGAVGLSPSLLIRNSVFAMAAGDGINGVFGQYPQIVNNVVYENGQDGGEEGIEADASTGFSQLYVANSIVTRNSQDLDDSPLVRAFWSLIGDEIPAAFFGNVFGDPVFVGSTDLHDWNAFFRLGASSPAIDRGNPDPAYNDPDGTRNDMGAFGGPGAGTVGFQGVQAVIPQQVIGLRPFADLFTGRRLLDPANNLVLVFARNVDAATVGTGSIVITQNGAPVDGTFTTAGNQVTFNPTADLTAGAEVTVTVNTNLRSTEGAALPFAWTQTIAVRPTAVPEVEGNDSPAAAQTLTVPTFRIAGAIGAGQQDFYEVTVAQGERIMASVFANRDGTGGDLRLTLLDTDGTTVLTVDDDSFGPGGVDPYIDFTANAAGTYFLLVEEQIGGAGPFDYELWGWVR